MQVFHFFFQFLFFDQLLYSSNIFHKHRNGQKYQICVSFEDAVFIFGYLLIECLTEFIFKMLKSCLVEPMVSSGSHCNINYHNKHYKCNVWIRTPKLIQLVIFYCSYIKLLILCIITFSFTIIFKLINIKFRFFHPFNDNL